MSDDTVGPPRRRRKKVPPTDWALVAEVVAPEADGCPVTALPERDADPFFTGGDVPRKRLLRKGWFWDAR
jgi:hypothetical protein